MKFIYFLFFFPLYLEYITIFNGNKVFIFYKVVAGERKNSRDPIKNLGGDFCSVIPAWTHLPIIPEPHSVNLHSKWRPNTNKNYTRSKGEMEIGNALIVVLLIHSGPV
jgi:hypothetical protein